MRFFRRKQPAAAADQRAELRSELVHLTELFGPKLALQVMADGVSLEDALLAEVERLRGVIEIRDAQIDEQHERLWMLESD